MIVKGHVTSSYIEGKSGLMKWLSKLFGGSCGGTSNGRQPQIMGEENMFWRRPTRSLDDQSRAENEELDCAIALSLAEDAKRRDGYRGQTNDEDLARALQESLTSPLYRPYTPVQYLPRGYRICGGCKREIGYGHYLSCMRTFLHPQCFRCYACSQPICESEFSLSGSNPYHKRCYKELHHPKCDVYHQFIRIPINRAGLIEYRAHPLWGQKYCPSHEHDNTPRCCSCEKMEDVIPMHVFIEMIVYLIGFYQLILQEVMREKELKLRTDIYKILLQDETES